MSETTPPGETPESATRWLEPGEQRVWRDYLEATALLSRRLSDELDRSGPDLVMSEYELLVRLSEAPDWSLRMSDLADGLVHSRSRLTHAIARMEARGLVDRRACPGDRRGVLAVMTPAGFAALEQAAPVHVTGVRTHLFDQLGPDQVEALGGIVSALAAHLRPGSGCPAMSASSGEPSADASADASPGPSSEHCAEGQAEQVGGGCCTEPDGQLAQPAHQHS